MTISEARVEYNKAMEVHDREFREGRIPSGAIIRECRRTHAVLDALVRTGMGLPSFGAK